MQLLLLTLLDETASLGEHLNTFDYEMNRKTVERDQKLNAYHDQLLQVRNRRHLSAEAVAQLKECTEIGWLYKRGAHNTQWKKRWFELKNYTLRYSAQPGDTVPKGEINVFAVTGNGVVPPDSDHEFVFHLAIEGTRTYILAADTLEEKARWLEKIAKVRQIIEEDVSRQKARARPLA